MGHDARGAKRPMPICGISLRGGYAMALLHEDAPETIVFEPFFMEEGDADARDLVRLLHRLRVKTVVIESDPARPRGGHLVDVAVERLGIRKVGVTSAELRQALGVAYGRRGAQAGAESRWPGLGLFGRDGGDVRAEAALLAVYGLKRRGR